MSRLEELIAELCPDGVFYTTVGSVSRTLSPSKKIKSNDYLDVGKYPVIDQGKKYIGGFTNEDGAFKKGEYVIFGDHTCVVKYVDFPFVQGADGVKVIEATNEIIPKFLYYCMCSIRIDAGYARHWAKMRESVIPVPPLPVQREIVKILDNFTELTAELTTELTAELTARQKQYKYYASMLFENAKAVRPTTLDEISENCDYMRKPVTSGIREAGSIPYYGASGIVDYVKDYIFDGDYLLISEDGANLIARSTPIAFSITGKTWVNNHAHILKFKSMATQKYVERYLNLLDLTPFVTGAAQPKLNQKNLNLIQIPLPPMEEQIKIMSILDRFDTIANDITNGLPTEIAARQKQYEYYRDKLLTFKQAEVFQ